MADQRQDPEQDASGQEGTQDHLGGPTPGVDRGAGTTSARGDTDGATTTGATTTGQGSVGTAQPPGDPIPDVPASGGPLHASETFGAQGGAVGETPEPGRGDPDVRADDAAQPAQRLDPEGG